MNSRAWALHAARRKGAESEMPRVRRVKVKPGLRRLSLMRGERGCVSAPRWRTDFIIMGLTLYFARSKIRDNNGAYALLLQMITSCFRCISRTRLVPGKRNRHWVDRESR
jgi:hypothetical protein